MSQSEISNQKEQSDQQIAGFIMKTYDILSNPEYNKIIFWTPSGQEFVIKDINKFEDIVLPQHFRHSKINSFIRQLNMYGFHKSRKDTTKSIFSHPCFQKQRFDLLAYIKRKVKLPERVLKTPVKKPVNAVQSTPKTKMQTEEKKPKENISESEIKNNEVYESKIRLDSHINLNMPLSINSLGNSLDGLIGKNEDVSLEHLLQEKESQKQNIMLINPSMFINSFKE